MAAALETHGYRNHEFGDSVLIERASDRAARERYFAPTPMIGP